MASETFLVYPQDKADFDTKIAPDAKEGKQLNVFCSFTYITPNYAVLFTLEELKKFADSGNYKIFIVLWDMNTLANPYFRKLNSLKKVASQSSFIDQKVNEIRIMADSIGFNKEKFTVYKSSDLWKRLISYQEDDLFQQFYSVLAQMKTTNFSVSGNKLSHLIQIPMDIFFCNYFHKLYPEDVEKPIDLAFFGENKKELYLSTRALMLKEGIIQHKNPIFILMKNILYLIYNDSVPEWNMSLREIKDIVVGCNFPKKDIFALFKHIEENAGSIMVPAGKEIEELDYQTFYKKYAEADLKELYHLLAENLHSYLQDRKKRYMETSGQIEEKILTISTRKEVQDIGSVLKSTIALEILLRADGNRTTTQIAKELGKSVATISTYANNLKKIKLIRVLSNGKIKRNIKGVKINLELGI